MDDGQLTIKYKRGFVIQDEASFATSYILIETIM